MAQTIVILSPHFPPHYHRFWLNDFGNAWHPAAVVGSDDVCSRVLDHSRGLER